MLLNTPRGGVPAVADTTETIEAAARELRRGYGPFAIDTERASAFRYDDRAFLLQIRRAHNPDSHEGATFLIDPEGNHAAIRRYLAPVVEQDSWIIHAASTDLPCLTQLGLYTNEVFDTELAARLCGYEKSNLAAVVFKVFGYELEKKFGDADWSTRPLPSKWLAYAALDVELLLELAQVLADELRQQGKTTWAQQEFEHILNSYNIPTVAGFNRTWHGLKGIARLRSPEKLQVAAHLWTLRDKLARDRDIAPVKILRDHAIMELAEKLPNTPRDVRKMRNFRPRNMKQTMFWLSAVKEARLVDSTSWPQPETGTNEVPPRRIFQQEFPEVWEQYQQTKVELTELATKHGIPLECLLDPNTQRAVVWACEGPKDVSQVYSLAGSIKRRSELNTLLERMDARPWQIELTSELLSQTLLD